MKYLVCFLALLAPAFGASMENSGIDTVVNGIPTGASQIAVAIDVVAPPAAAEYDDPAQQAAVQQQQVLQQLPPPQPAAAVAAAAAPQPAAAPAAAPQAGQRQGLRGRRGRPGGFGAGPVTVSPSYLTAVPTHGATSLTVHTNVAAGSNYRVRVVAIKGDGPFPTVLGGGKTAGIKAEADQVAHASVLVTAPMLKLAADNPSAVAAGSHYTLAGTITDPSSFLGTKSRMRVWLNDGTPPAANYDGVQVSTVKVTMKDDDVTFTFDLTAPKKPTTLYFQLGEVSPDFASKDGSQAAFLVVPDLSAGASALQLKVEAAKPSVASRD